MEGLDEPPSLNSPLLHVTSEDLMTTYRYVDLCFYFTSAQITSTNGFIYCQSLDSPMNWTGTTCWKTPVLLSNRNHQVCIAFNHSFVVEPNVTCPDSSLPLPVLSLGTLLGVGEHKPLTGTRSSDSVFGNKNHGDKKKGSSAKGSAKRNRYRTEEKRPYKE